MTADEYEQLPPEEKEHFARCSECGEIFDRRSLDEVLWSKTQSVSGGDNLAECPLVRFPGLGLAVCNHALQLTRRAVPAARRKP
jgi:hypothetical protein